MRGSLILSILIAFAFFVVTPLMAADISLPRAPEMPTAPQAPVIEKPNLAEGAKQKTADMIDKAKSGLDKKAEGLKESLEDKKNLPKGKNGGCYKRNNHH